MTFVLLVIIAQGARHDRCHANLVSTVRMWRWLNLLEIARLVISVMIVQLCETSLIVRLAIIAHLAQESQFLALKANSLIQQRTQKLQIAEIVPLVNTVLVQEILLQLRNVPLIIIAQVDKVHQHPENTCAQQVTFAKQGQPSLSDVKMVPSKMNVENVFVRFVLKVTTAMPQIWPLLMQHYVLLVIIARLVLGTIETSHARSVSSVGILIFCAQRLSFDILCLSTF